MPQLGIMGAAKGKSGFGFVWATCGLSVIVIDEACHSKLEYFVAIGTRVSGTVAVVIIGIETGAAVECPDGGRGAAALAGTKYREFIGVRVGVIRDT